MSPQAAGPTATLGLQGQISREWQVSAVPQDFPKGPELSAVVPLASVEESAQKQSAGAGAELRYVCVLVHISLKEV